MEIVLYQPEIPGNTGNIARTCAVTGTPLHLIRPLGFLLEDKYLKRAGLDYWEDLELHVHESWEAFREQHPGPCFYLSTKGRQAYDQMEYPREGFLVFGPETRGLPMEILEKDWDRVCRIPMGDKFRSLNLSNAAAIVLYEALRQQGFPGMR